MTWQTLPTGYTTVTKDTSALAAIDIRGVHKRFGATHALRGVDLKILRGRVHALLGANGCGKSTLVKVLAGYHKLDEGEVTWADDNEGAIAFVHQDLGLIPTLTVAENLALSAGYSMRGPAIDWAAQRRATRALLDQHGIECSPGDPVGSLGPAEQTMVAIVRAIVGLKSNSGVLVLDEPTARLPASEAGRLLKMIRRLTAKGVAVLYISHRLDEVLEIADEVTILRDGAKVFAGDIGQLNRKTLIHHIVGQELEQGSATDHQVEFAARPKLLEVEKLSGVRLRNVSLDIHEGEILGIVGLVGSGRSELGRIIFGLQQSYGGRIALKGTDITDIDCAGAVTLGMGYVPQERREGIFRGLSVGENSILADLASITTGIGVSAAKARAAAARVVTEFRVKTRSINAAIETLSGGNQQKVSLGKWLQRDVRLMILDEPTQGIDIGARTEIFHIIRKMAESRGIGALVLDSDLDILAEHCDRVLVMVRGRVTREFKRNELSATALSHEVYGH